MKIFCSKCGVGKEVEDTARGAFVTCSACGNRFNVGGVAPAAKSGMSTTMIVVIVAVAAVPVVVAVIGILAAIAIPNFIRFQSRSKQSECKSNLKALYTAERTYFDEHHTYSPYLAQVGFAPERGNRYAYFTDRGPVELRTGMTADKTDRDTGVGVDLFKFPAQTAVTQRDLPQAIAGGSTIGVGGTCPDCALVAVCAGNIDNDEVLDVWPISTAPRTTAGGQPIAAGEPFNDVNDVTE